MPQKAIIGEIYKIGLPAIVMQALMSVMTYGVNILLGAVSTNLVTAYGVYYKIQQFVFFAAFGLNNALIPITAYNYGKGNKERMRESIRYGILYTVVIMACGTLLLEGAETGIASLFRLSEETQRLCALAMRIIAIGYVFAGANIALQGLLQAFGHGGH